MYAVVIPMVCLSRIFSRCLPDEIMRKVNNILPMFASILFVVIVWYCYENNKNEILKIGEDFKTSCN